MIPHFIILILAIPMQLLLGFWNNKSKLLDRGEVGFWSMVIFLAAEMFYLGVLR